MSTRTRVTLTVDGERRDFDPRPDEILTRLLSAEPGVRHGCADGTCGECTVLVDGEPTRSCLVFAVQCAGADVRTR